MSATDAKAITRAYFDSLLLEQRLLGTRMPDTAVEIFGERFASPIMTAALSHLGTFIPDAASPMENYAKGAYDAGCVHWYGMGENEEFDETITLNYTYGEGQSAEIKDAVLIDSVFESPFYMVASMTSAPIRFYETAPASVDGDVYVGYLAKTGGMGSMVYAYSVCLKADNTFSVSIMQLASVMHVWGESVGTYAIDGDKITFTYGVSDGEGGIAAEDFVSEGVGYSAEGFEVGFNIGQTNVRASNAVFIKVK